MSWQVIRRQVLWDAAPWLQLTTEHVRLPNGVEIPDFYRIHMRSYVAIFAVTTDQQVAMLEHYKHGPEAVSIEFPAGYIEENDDPLETAKRELREETGLVSQNWQFLDRGFIDGNRGCGWVYTFLARDAVFAGETQHESTEIMTLHLKSLDEVCDLWLAGKMINAPMQGMVGRALVELGYLRKNHE